MLIFLIVEVIGAVLKQLFVGPLLKLSFEVLVLGCDPLHMRWLLDFVFLDNLLYIHFEALASAHVVTIFCEDDNEAWVDPFFINFPSIRRFFGPLNYRRQRLRYTCQLFGPQGLHRLLSLLDVGQPDAKRIFLKLTDLTFFLV